jgi:hypothetical protein
VSLAQEIERAKQREQIAKWDEGERKLAAELRPVKVPITQDVVTRFSVFGKWCMARSVRKLPAKPTTVAAFCLEQRDLGAIPQIILALLAAIEAVHNSHSLSNPCATAIVDEALKEIVRSDPPRSWRADERAEWARLPPPVRDAITRREADRDREVRRVQSELARLRHDSAVEPVNLNSKEVQHDYSQA